MKLENDGALVEALDAFKAIPDQQDVHVRMHIAGCTRKLGRMREAIRLYQQIVDDPKVDAAAKETAASDRDDASEKIPKLKLALTPASTGAAVTVDAETVSPPVLFPVDPGEHVVRAKHGDRIAFERKVHVSEGTTLDIVIDASPVVEASEPAKPITVETKSDEAPTVPSSSSSKTIAFVALGVGAASIAAGTFFYLRMGSLKSERDELALRGDDAALDRASDARSAQTFARVGFGLGVVGLATAGWFFYDASKTKSTASMRIAPAVGATWGLTLQGGF